MVFVAEQTLQLKATISSSITPRLPARNTTDTDGTVFTIQLDEYSDEIEDVLEIFSTISDFFPPHIVDSFHFETNLVHPDLEDWDPPLLEWAEVRNVKLDGTGAAQWLIPYLSETEDYSSDGQESEEAREAERPKELLVVFPNMTSLCLHRIRMHEALFGCMLTMDLNWKHVMRMLRVRAGSRDGPGKATQSMRLKISRCRVREWRVKEVIKKGWVQDDMLEWDRDEGEDVDEGEET